MKEEFKKPSSFEILIVFLLTVITIGFGITRIQFDQWMRSIEVTQTTVQETLSKIPQDGLGKATAVKGYTVPAGYTFAPQQVYWFTAPMTTTTSEDKDVLDGVRDYVVKQGGGVIALCFDQIDPKAWSCEIFRVGEP